MYIGTPFVAVYDANVLFPAPIRDALLWIATTGLVQAKWTDEIHDEWIRNLLKVKPHLDPKKLNRTRNLMNQAVPDCLVEHYQDLIPSLNLPDPNDRHVLAAAVRSGAQTIVTENIKDFPRAELDKYDIAAEPADQFILGLIDIDAGAVAEALREQHAHLTNPSFTKDEFLTNLAHAGLLQTAAAIRPLF